jgi:hypothetical protein
MGDGASSTVQLELPYSGLCLRGELTGSRCDRATVLCGTDSPLRTVVRKVVPPPTVRGRTIARLKPRDYTKRCAYGRGRRERALRSARALIDRPISASSAAAWTAVPTGPLVASLAGVLSGRPACDFAAGARSSGSAWPPTRAFAWLGVATGFGLATRRGLGAFFCAAGRLALAGVAALRFEAEVLPLAALGPDLPALRAVRATGAGFGSGTPAAGGTVAAA